MSVTAYHFWSPTCAPCKTIKPAIQELVEEFPSIPWISVNTQDDKNSYAITYGVRVVPTVVVVVLDESGAQISVESHSGTGIAGYYRILRGGLKKLSST